MRCRDGTGWSSARFEVLSGRFPSVLSSLVRWRECWSPGRFSGVWVREGRGWAWSIELRACESDKRGTSDPKPDLA